MISLIRSMNFSGILIYVIAVALSMGIHESAHALAAYWMKDPTARRMGRVSLNPFAHIDWMGVACFLLFGFGWAQPVEINPWNFKDPKLGSALSALAGPLSNFLLSFVFIFLFYLAQILGMPSTGFGGFIYSLLSQTAILSAGFGVFNLLPIPPLDGAKVFFSFLPDREYFKLNNPPAWVTFALMLLIVSGLLSTPLSMMRGTLINWMSSGSMAILSLFL